MLDEFARVVSAALPEWWLLENVPGVPDVRIYGYNWQRFELNQSWFVSVSRLRHFQFGSRSGIVLDPPTGTPHKNCAPAAIAMDDRPFRTVAKLQGLPDDFELPGMTHAGAVAAVGNGVPLVLGRAIARCLLSAYGHSTSADKVTDYSDVASLIRCACGCGRILQGRRKTATAACRQRLHRQRKS